MLFLLALIAQPASAQLIRGKIISVGIGGTNGSGGLYRPGSWVPVQVRLENRSGRDFEGRLEVDQPDLDGDRVACLGPKFVLQATEVNDRVFWAYYWPSPDDELKGIKSVVVVDKNGVPITNVTTPDGQFPQGGGGIGAQDTNGRSSRYVLLLSNSQMGWSAFRGAFAGTEAVRFGQVSEARQLPDDVKGFDAVDVIVWQADDIKVSDLPPDFQLKAMIDWVKAGGHLIISVGTQGQEFTKGPAFLSDAMPINFTGNRTLKMESLATIMGGKSFGEVRTGNGAVAVPGNATLFSQAIGTLKPGARPMSGGDLGEFADHPLMVTGLCGRGAITVLTMNAGHPELDRVLGANEKDWIAFWNQVAGWQSPNPPVTGAELLANPGLVSLPPRYISLGTDLSSQVDVKEVTEIRILVAVLFLAAYWLIAGPVGHLVLRHYKVVHWSWWIFGATVICATVLAGMVVLALHVKATKIRHRTFVLGTVNSPDVTVLGFYGVYAPHSGPLEISQPDTAGGGMNYLVPLAVPTAAFNPVKPFADVQGYDLYADRPNLIKPIFRQTLKKLEGRWTGSHPGIDGEAQYTGNKMTGLRGALVNNSGYDLENVQVIVYLANPDNALRVGQSYLYTLPAWSKGQRIDLEKDLVIDPLGAPAGNAWSVETLLKLTGWKLGEGRSVGGNGITASDISSAGERSVFNRNLSDELLYVLLDLRPPDHLKEDIGFPHYESVRGIARLLDSTKALHAAGALIVAHAGSIPGKKFVDTPVPLTVGGAAVPGEGEILFAWSLPVAGKMVAAGLGAGGGIIPDGPPAPARGRGFPRPLPQPEAP